MKEEPSHLSLAGASGSETTWREWSLWPVGSGEGESRGLLFCLERDAAWALAREEPGGEPSLQAAIVESMAAAVAGFDREGRLIYCNPAFVSMLGWSASELLGSGPPFPFWPQDAADGYRVGFEACLRGAGEERIERCYRRKDGRPIWVLISCAPLLDDRNHTVGMIKTMLDISDRRAAEQALRQSEERYHDLVETSPDGTVVLVRGKIVYANPAALRLAGAADFRDLALREVLHFVHPDDRERVRRGLEELERSQPRLIPLHQIRVVGPAGVELTVEFSATRVSYHGQQAVQAVFRDVTERARMEGRIRQTERKLRQIEKLASLGLLTSAIIHEINNPSGFILMSLQGLRDGLRRFTDPEVEAGLPAGSRSGRGTSREEFLSDLRLLVDNIEHGAERISNTVAKLRGFLHGRETTDKRFVPFEQIVRTAADMCRADLVRHGVRRFELDLPAQMLSLPCDEDLGVILINLLINAAQAADKADSWVRVCARDGDPLLLEVLDNGCGMDEETRRRAFEPFFTTKPRGQGTGLGLYICQDVADSLGVRLEMESRPGEGSVFRVLVPRVASQPPIRA